MIFHFTHGARAALTLTAIVSVTSAQSGAQQLANCAPPDRQQIERAAAAGNCDGVRNCSAACQRGKKCPPPCVNPPKTQGANPNSDGGKPPKSGGGKPPNDGAGRFPSGGKNPPSDGGRNPQNPGGWIPPRGGGWVPPPPSDQGRNDWLLTVLATGIATAATIAAIDEMTGKGWASTEELDRNGPRFPVQQSLGRFQAQGFALPGWPFAVDLETEPGTVTWLEVRYKGHHEQPRTLYLAGPEGGRRIQLVNLPPAPDSLGIARYSIQSAILQQGQEPQYRPLRIFGIGAGPQAVGALDSSAGAGPPRAAFAQSPVSKTRSWLQRPAISPGRAGARFFRAAFAAQSGGDIGSYLSILAFGPQQASNPADVSWAVAARRRFPRSKLEVLLVPGDEKGKYVLVTSSAIDLLARSQASGSWREIAGNADIAAGTYELQARAWRTKAEGGDWTGAFAPDYVHLQ